MRYFEHRMRQPADPTLTPHGLDALSPDRQRTLLWRIARDFTRDEAAEHMPEWTARPCPVYPRGPSTYTGAVLGDDGRHHLWHENTGIVCTEEAAASPEGGPWAHKDTYVWKTAEKRLRQRTVSWQVQPAGEPVHADLVPWAERCWAQDSILRWPEWVDMSSPKTRERWRVAEQAGFGCSVCGGGGLAFMDHDPFTGLIRGMLCTHCNNNVDLCPHAEGCMWGEYLDDPPAVHLGLMYPRLANTRARTLERVALRGWDPGLFADVRAWRERNPGQGALW
ncbi:endonuclease domain-containing protein [Nocardiopsis sp. CT-R113]|uniref:Endonuclease domain-containing protein n=1 Tax=Nocardiopsis codii TaxID=3065942 RepID=A0ABU7KDC3_9ACTN|nr:endonuclease domain-containing protein [Nocardiopsis sp. CT-R113]MEE2040224.1 endonuclease domain-containing protein [Nocardiopsis sp. CT-R113]